MHNLNVQNLNVQNLNVQNLNAHLLYFFHNRVKAKFSFSSDGLDPFTKIN